jgi:hypothetical protein
VFFRGFGVVFFHGALKTMPHGLKTNSYTSIGLPEAATLREGTKDVVTYIHSLPVKTKSKVEIAVIFTSFDLTQEAIKSASVMAMRVGARVAVVAAQVVPYPLPLDKPPVPYGFIFRRFEALVEQFPMKTEFRVFLCRDQLQCLKSLHSTGSPIVMCIRKSFWPTRDKRLARKLRRAGHEVTLVEKE